MAPAIATYDVIVVGAGPAGCALGRLLATWGHPTLILARERHAAHGMAESIPPSARKLLRATGLLDAVEAAGFPPNRGNAVWWGSTDGRLEGFGEAEEVEGFQVFRPDLDALLRTQAAAAGADVRAGSTARHIRFAADSGVEVEYEADGRRFTAAARFVVDASGRAGVIARRGLRRYEPGHRMQAYLGMWRLGPDQAAAGHDRTLVETYDDGWAWSLAVSSTVRQVACMVDASTTRTTKGPTIGHAYAAELAKARHVRALTGGAVLERVWGCDASLYSAETMAGPQFLLVGDAACCIDPLSSFGVKKALASGWLGAVALHTALVDEGRLPLALDFFVAREREVYAAELARTREYARRAAAHHDRPFWHARAAGTGTASAPSSVDALLSGEAVRAAHARLRAAAAIDLRWRRATPFASRPVVRGRTIVLENAVVLASGAVRFAAGIDLVSLGEAAQRHRQVPDAYAEYCRTQGAVPLPDFLAALSLLVADGALAASDIFV